MSQDIIGTWLVTDGNDDASFFPQVGLNSAHQSFQNVYWRCVACFYATSVRLNPHVKHVFFTNTDRIPTVRDVDLRAFLVDLGVEIRHLPITHRLGKDRVSAWNNQFYILDIIRHLTADESFGSVIIMDSDCAWVRSADEFFEDITRRGILSLSMSYAAEEKVNGASRRDLMLAAEQLTGHRLRFTPHYSGGELFAATRERVADIDSLAQTMWARLVSAAPGAIDVYEEAHFLSIIYEILDVPVGTADVHSRRMWTALRLNVVTAEDVDSSRCVWHLPMEKKTGFVDLFAVVTDRRSWFWEVPPADLRKGIARTMGIPKRSARQWAAQADSRMRFYWAKWLDKMGMKALASKVTT